MWGVTLSALEAVGLSPLSPVAYLLGANLPAVNLIFSILAVYPVSIAYEKCMSDKDDNSKHLFFLLAGLDIAWFNLGLDVYHGLLAIVVFVVTAAVVGPGKIHTTITFIFNMVYLLAGYYYTESEMYDITWTMPHCVLALKLIGCSFDIWDGTEPPEKLSEMNKKTALSRVPNLLELMGFVYFPAAFLVGPQFSMKRYQNMVKGKFPLATATPDYREVAWSRFAVGLLYLGMYQLGNAIFSQNKLTSDFQDYSFIYKHVFIGFWGRFLLYKYLACWILTEASCIRLGLAYDGEENGTTKWTGAENIRLMRFETALKFGHYIESFNVNTNNWVGQYIFRRLKFLGNKYLSQFMSLLFLAVWHGLMSGYYMTFAMEYFIMFLEKDLEPMLDRLEVYQKMWSNPLARYCLYALLKIYTFVFMGYCLVPFDLKVFSKWWTVYYQLGFSGFVVFVPWAFVYKPALQSLINNGYLK